MKLSKINVCQEWLLCFDWFGLFKVSFLFVELVFLINLLLKIQKLLIYAYNILICHGTYCYLRVRPVKTAINKTRHLYQCFSTRCQFHQHFTYKFFVRTSFWQLFLCTCNQRKAAEATFERKIHRQNVDEIDSWVPRNPEVPFFLHRVP